MSLFTLPMIRATDANGIPLPGATLTFYVTDTLTLADVYTTAERNVAHENPLEADGGGLVPAVYLDPSVVYRAVLKDALGATIGDVDPINSADDLTWFGLKSGLAGAGIPSEITLIRSSGYTEPGAGAADYVYSAAVDAAYVAANPRTSFLADDGRGFKLAEAVRTPAMFGALGVREGQTDATMTDDGEALQAFFNDAFPIENKSNVYDFSGRWATARSLYACYPIDQAGSPLHEHAQRRFICGEIRALPITRQAGGVAMTNLLTIGGSHQRWEGLMYLCGLDDAGECPTYANKRFVNALRLYNASFTTFDAVEGEGSKRDTVYFDPSVATTTFQSGTDYEVTYTYSNNIGIRFDQIFGRESGANTHGARHLYTKNWTALAHGGVAAGVFDPTPASYTGSTAQRTRLTFDTTADFQQYDYGLFRLELVPADYTTIAADNTAGTLTWAAGDPVTEGLVVGDKITPQSGANADVVFEIIAFSGGSNRTIKVWPKPTTEAATAITGLYTRWNVYQVMEIPSATQILVSPWMEDRATSTGKWTFTHGFAANVSGPNTANVSFGLIAGLNHCGALNSACLYGPHVSSIIGEACSYGAIIGTALNNVNLGTVIDHHHFEICDFDVIQNTQSNSLRNIIKGSSNLHLDKSLAFYIKAATTDALPYPRAFYFMTLDQGGEILANRQALSYSATTSTAFTVSNRPGQRQTHKIMNGAITCTLEFDHDESRLFGDHHWAEIHWIGPGGAAPTGDLTFALSAELTHRGWTIVGTNPISGPAKPCRVLIHFYSEDKKALLTQFNAI